MEVVCCAVVVAVVELDGERLVVVLVEPDPRPAGRLVVGPGRAVVSPGRTVLPLVSVATTGGRLAIVVGASGATTPSPPS